MAFRLTTLPLLGGTKAKFLKDSGYDDYGDYSDYTADDVIDPEVYPEDSTDYGTDSHTYDDGTDYGTDYGTDGTSEETGDGYDDGTGGADLLDSETVEGNYDETPVQLEDGSWTYTDVDGTNYFEDVEGNTMVTNTDGSGSAYLSDGTVYSWDADGNEIVTAEDGTTLSLTPDYASNAPSDKSNPRAKASALAQGAIDAANKIAAGSNKATQPKPTPAVVKKPTAIQNLAKQKVTTGGGILAGLSIGTVLLLGATGAILYNMNKKKR